MYKSININWSIAPKQWTKFKRWHEAACSLDSLTAKERFMQEGGIMPKRRVKNDSIGIKKKVK